MKVQVNNPDGVGEVVVQDDTAILELFDAVRAKVELHQGASVTFTCKSPPETSDSAMLNNLIRKHAKQSGGSGDDAPDAKKRRVGPANDDLRAEQVGQIKWLTSQLANTGASCPLFPSAPFGDIPADINEKVGQETEKSVVAIAIPGRESKLICRKVAGDGNCLFNAVGQALRGHAPYNEEEFEANKLRRRVTNFIREQSQVNPEEWSSCHLEDKSVEEYCEHMLTPGTWGGAIELKCLSESFGVEIVVLEPQHEVRVHRFGEDKGYPSHCVVIYHDTHYDRISEVHEENQSTCVDINRWETYEFEGVVQAAKRLVSSLTSPQDNETGKVLEVVPSNLGNSLPTLRETPRPKSPEPCSNMGESQPALPDCPPDCPPDLSSFKVGCLDCGHICVGQRAVVDHINTSGHWGGFTENV